MQLCPKCSLDIQIKMPLYFVGTKAFCSIECPEYRKARQQERMREALEHTKLCSFDERTLDRMSRR